MNDTAIILKPSYWASISGGKDSLVIINKYLSRLEKELEKLKLL